MFELGNDDVFKRNVMVYGRLVDKLTGTTYGACMLNQKEEPGSTLVCAPARINEGNERTIDPDLQKVSRIALI